MRLKAFLRRLFDGLLRVVLLSSSFRVAAPSFPLLLKICAAALGLALLVFFFWPALTTFVVVAESEIVEATVAPGSSVSWRLAGALVCAGESVPQRPNSSWRETSPCGGAPVALDAFDGHIDIQGPLQLRVERLSAGSLEIGLWAEAEDASSMRFRELGDDSSILRLDLPVNIRLLEPASPSDHALPISLPLIARGVTFGREMTLRGVESQPILRSGSVTLIGHSLLGQRTYAARKVALEQGDSVTSPSPQSSFGCLLRVDERPGIQGLFRVQAYHLAIRGFFSEPRFESLSFLDKVLNDRLVGAISTLFGLLIAALASLWNNHKES